MGVVCAAFILWTHTDARAQIDSLCVFFTNHNQILDVWKYSPSRWCLTKPISACAVTLQSYSKVLGLFNTLQSTALVHSSHSNQLLWNTVLQRRPSSWQQQWKVTELEYVSLWLIWKYLQRQRCSLLSRPFCGAPRLSVYNHTIWPMISSSRCHSLKLFRYGLDRQRKLAFICSFSLILVARPFLSVSALRDLLFSSLRPFDLRCWDLVFTIQKESGGGEGRMRKSIVFFYYAAHLSTDICVVMGAIITPFNLLVVLL